jgi:hypothetical protein
MAANAEQDKASLPMSDCTDDLPAGIMPREDASSDMETASG